MKISPPSITGAFYILYMNKGSLNTRSFRRIHFSFLDTDELKMALGPEKFPGLSRNEPLGDVLFSKQPNLTCFVFDSVFSCE